MSVFVADPVGHGLHGRIRVPGDKSVSHRALLLAARAEGRSTIAGLSRGDDVSATRRAIQQFGAVVSGLDGPAPGTDWVVEGGKSRIGEPESVIDVGNSGTGIRLLAGWASGLEFLTVLQGDASIARRPMGRVTDPLRQMGARIDGRRDGRWPPLVVRGGGLKGIDYDLPVPSAQVKGAILLAALAAEGPTTIREEVPTRMHTEEMLAQCGAQITVAPGSVTLRPGPLQPAHFDVPGDPSQAAFWIVAACITPGSDLIVEHVYIGPGRAGFLDVLRRMGAAVELVEEDPATSTATIRVCHGPLAATRVGGPEVPALIDEIPVLAVAAAYADGVTTFSDASELKVKESDRIASMVSALASVGVRADPHPDGLSVHGHGGRPLPGGTVDSAGDHRVAMAMAVSGLASSRPVSISGWEAVATSYPGFEEDLRQCVS
jgi:3-phosphoshikimate 1-carboxyvinyltransferase